MALTKEQIEYAGDYSISVWKHLMENFDKIENYWIGANDVSDLVLNAILNAFDGMKFPDWSVPVVSNNPDSGCSPYPLLNDHELENA